MAHLRVVPRASPNLGDADPFRVVREQGGDPAGRLVHGPGREPDPVVLHHQPAPDQGTELRAVDPVGGGGRNGSAWTAVT